MSVLKDKNVPFFKRLRELMGYVQNGSHTKITISQDDATGSYIVRVGNYGINQQYYIADSLEEAFEKAFADPKNDPMN